MNTIFLDRQHAGKPSNATDRGAWGDLDQNGRQDWWEMEAMLTGRSGLEAEGRAIELGHAVIPLSDGTYPARHARVNEYAKTCGGKTPVYAAEHLNAVQGGGGDYALVGYDARSKAGPILAEHLAAAIMKHLSPEIKRVVIAPCGPTGNWSRAYSTIAGVYEGRAVGICFEPGFLTNPDHASLFTHTGLRRIGLALAEGVDAFWKL